MRAFKLADSGSFYKVALVLVLILSCQPVGFAAVQLTQEERQQALRPPVLVDNEIDHYVDLMRGKINTLLRAKKYDELDKMAHDRRVHLMMYWQGRTELGFFYTACENPDRRREMSEQDYLSRIDLISQWAKARTNSVTARVVLANLYHDYGWLARGRSYSYKVSDEGWRLLEERDGKAKAYLEEAKKLPEKCPEVLLTELQIYRGTNGYDDKFERMFAAATSAFPQYRPLYFEKAEALIPRWGGKEGDCQKFISACADKLGGVEGDKFYAQLAWRLHRYFDSEPPFTALHFDYARMARGFTAICAAYPKSSLPVSAYCRVAVAAQDKPTAARLFVRLSGRVDDVIWKNKDEFARALAFALG